MLFSIDLRIQKIIKLVLEIFNANLSKADHVLKLFYLSLQFCAHVNIFMLMKTFVSSANRMKPSIFDAL